MNKSPYLLQQANSLLRVCMLCHGMGQLKGYKMAPISVKDFGKAYNDKVPISHIITRCDDCMGTGEKIDWDKYCTFKQNNSWHVVQEVEKIFENYYQEIPS